MSYRTTNTRLNLSEYTQQFKVGKITLNEVNRLVIDITETIEIPGIIISKKEWRASVAGYIADGFDTSLMDGPKPFEATHVEGKISGDILVENYKLRNSDNYLTLSLIGHGALIQEENN